MRVLTRAVLASGLTVAAVLAVASVALALTLSRHPSLPRPPGWTLTELSRIDTVVGADLRRNPGSALTNERVLTVTQRDLEILLSQTASRWGEGRFQVRLDTGRASLRASLALPDTLLGPIFSPLVGPQNLAWLNLDARLSDATGMPIIESLQLGAVPVPGWLAGLALEWGLRQAVPRSQALAHIVQRVGFARGQTKLTLDWRDESPRALLAALLPGDEQQRVQAYAEHLTLLTRGLAARSTVSMADLIAPMFALAQRRSAGGAAAAAENRAALLALTLYANGRSLAPAMPNRSWRPSRNTALTLNGRPDSPLHFLISAALAAQAGGGLADAVGLYKEASDAQGGSGFSFNDLAADRAGTRFGLLAMQSPLQLQALLAAGVRESDLMPDVGDLPDALTAADFAQRFGRVGTPEYSRMLADIEARLDRCRVLKVGAATS